MKKAGVLGQEPVVHGHPAVDGVISVELLGAVLAVVLVRVQVLEHPSLGDALTIGGLATGPRASVPLYCAFYSRFGSKGGNGDEAGILEAHRVKLNRNKKVEPAQALL